MKSMKYGTRNKQTYALDFILILSYKNLKKGIPEEINKTKTNLSNHAHKHMHASKFDFPLKFTCNLRV